MIKYSSQINLNFYEFKSPSIHLYAKGPCNMNCHGCFNIGSLFEYEDSDLDIYQVVDYIVEQRDLFEYIVFTGGEYLVNPIEEIIEHLNFIRGYFPEKKFILYTNGLEYDKLQKVIDLRLFDGIHMDIKLPYHLLNNEDEDIVQLTIGRKLANTHIRRLLKSIEAVIVADAAESQLRTVKYPFSSEGSWHEIQLYIDELNEKHGKKVPYKLNEFVEVE